MRNAFLSVIFALGSGGAALAQSPLDAYCHTLVMSERNPDFMQREVNIFYDGYIEGMAQGRSSKKNLLASYYKVCTADPDLKVPFAMDRAINALKNGN